MSLSVWILTACTSNPGSQQNPNTSSGSPAAGLIVLTEPEYWPTLDWNTQTPEQQGFSGGVLQNLAAEAEAALPFYTSLLVIRNGYLVHESYHNTATETSDADTRHHVWSVTKSVNSLIVGRAITRGDITDVDAAAENVFPAAVLATLPGGDTRRSIRLSDALRMRSGLAWNESQWLLSADHDPLMRIQGGQPAGCLGAGSAALLCGIMDMPQAYQPGSTWNYSTYDSYIVSGFVTYLTGSPMATYGNDYLFSELGFTLGLPGDWTAFGMAHTYGGGTLKIKSRDLAKIGLLVQYRGKWNGTQLISQAWLDTSLAVQGNALRSAFDGDGNPTTAVSENIIYGMEWWRSIGPLMAGATSTTALGKFGQVMHIFPEKGLIVVLTSDSNQAEVTTDRYTPIASFIQSKILDRLPQ